jgi:hypothetical protein
MKNSDDIPTTDTTEIKQLINRVKQGELDQGDALLIEKLLNILLTIQEVKKRVLSGIGLDLRSFQQSSLIPERTRSSIALHQFAARTS